MISGSSPLMSGSHDDGACGKELGLSRTRGSQRSALLTSSWKALTGSFRRGRVRRASPLRTRSSRPRGQPRTGLGRDSRGLSLTGSLPLRAAAEAGTRASCTHGGRRRRALRVDAELTMVADRAAQPRRRRVGSDAGDAGRSDGHGRTRRAQRRRQAARDARRDRCGARLRRAGTRDHREAGRSSKPQPTR